MIDEDNKALPCAGKLAFETQRQAKAAAVVAKHQHDSKLRVYKCRFCGLYHLATK